MTDATVQREEIEGLDLFESVDLDVVFHELHSAPVILLDRDEILMEAGTPNNRVYVLLAGRLRVHLVSVDEAAAVTLEPGATVGEISLLDRQPVPGYVVADTAARVLAIDDERLWRLTGLSHALSNNLLTAVANRLRILNSGNLISSSHQRLREQLQLLERERQALQENRRLLDSTAAELERREQALAESETQLRNVIEGSIQGILVLTPEGRPLFANQAAAKIFGYSSVQDLLQLPNINKHTAPHEIDRLIAYSGARLAGQNALNEYEYEAIHKNGSPLVLQNNVRLVRWQGKPAMQCTLIDVTALKERETQLLQTRDQLVDILESLSEGLVVSDQDDRIVLANERLRQLFPDVAELLVPGTRFEDVVRALALRNAYHFQGIKDVEAIVDRRMALHRDAPVDHVTESSDGQWYQISERLTRAGGVVSTLVDISELKRREQALRESEERYSLALQGANEGLWDWRVHNDVLHLSIHAMAILGLEGAQDRRGKDVWKSCVHPQDYNGWQSALFEHLRGSTPYLRIEARIVSRSDQERWIFVHGLGLRSEDGKVYRMAGSIADIHEHKKVEEERTRIEADLHRARQSAAEEEAANQAKGTFLAKMSHELRTPMNAVIGMSHLALQTQLTEQQQDYLSKIQSAGKALMGIIDDILDVSKIESGKLELESVVFDLDTVLEQVSDLFASRAQEKSLEFLVFRAAEVPAELTGDPLRLQQVLVNLAGNALKFTERGEIVLAVNRIAQKANEAILRFSVRDTGIGIEPEALEELFQPFSQADTSTTREYGGTGLGLTISQQLVEMMGGRITARSNPGQGSIFEFDLHLTVAAAGANNRGSAELTTLDGIRILIVDDNRAAREIQAEMARGLSLQAAAAGSGREALAELERVAADHNARPYDVVLMDWKMPEIDGIETARRIQASSRLNPTPTLILVTAYDKDEAIELARDVGFGAILNKPLHASLLWDAIVSIFGAESVPTPKIGAQQSPTRLTGNVLVAEDNAVNQQVITELLQGFGLLVDVVNNGREAVQQADRKSYDMVLMDIQMPVMDGYQAARKIRALSKLRRLPIVAMTAHALVKDRETALQSGMNEHLTKPIDPQRLFKVVASYLSQDSPVAGSTPRLTPLAAADAAVLPVSTPQLDVQTGLARVRNDASAYCKMLRTFIEDHQHDPSKLEAALAGQDRTGAAAIAHALKGAAGTVGAVPLHHAAGALEHVLTAQEDDTDSLEQCGDRHRKLFAELAEWPAPRAPQLQPAGAVDPKALQQALLALRDRVRDRSFDADSYLEPIAAALAGNQSETYRALARAVERFQFETAEQLVADLLRLFGE